MRIGIDIDDVITDTSSSMKEYIIRYDNNGKIYKHMEEIMRGEMPTKDVKNFLDENSISIFKSAKVKEHASEVMQRLLNNGNEIFIITSRGEIKFKGSEKLTLEYLKMNNINYTNIIFNCFDKAKVCKDNNIDLMVDDSIKYCTEIQKENIRSIVFTSEVNKSTYTPIERASTWLDLENKISKGK